MRGVPEQIPLTSVVDKSVCGWAVHCECPDCGLVARTIPTAKPYDTETDAEDTFAHQLGWKLLPTEHGGDWFYCSICAAKRLEEEEMAKNGTNGNGKQAKSDESLVKVERFVEELKVQLTTDQVAERADRAAHLVGTKSELENKAKEQSQHAKAEIAKVALEIGQLSNAVRTKSEYKDVQCERHYLFRTTEVVEVRTDTGEELSRRPMCESEKQLELKLHEEQKAKAEEAAEASTENRDTQPEPAPDEPLPTEKRKRGRPKKGAQAEATP